MLRGEQNLSNIGNSSSNNPSDDSTHRHQQMVNTEIRLIIFFATKDGEALYSQQKQDRGIEKKWNYIKKKTLSYKEQDKEKVKEYLEKIENIHQEEINYIDETGIQNFLHREYAYAPRGEKVYDNVSRKKFKRTNIVAAKEEIKSLHLYSMNAL